MEDQLSLQRAQIGQDLVPMWLSLTVVHLSVHDPPVPGIVQSRSENKEHEETARQVESIR